MNTDQLTISEAIMVLLKEYNADQETIEHLLDKITDDYDTWAMKWAKESFSAAFPGLEGEPPEYELEWA